MQRVLGWFLVSFVLLACGDDSSPGLDGGHGVDGGGDDEGRWVTVNEPIALFPESAIYEEHLVHEGTLFLRYRDASSARLIRYDGGPFEMVPDGDASIFGSDLFVFEGTIHMSYLQVLGAGMNRVGLARLQGGAFEVVEANVVEVGPADPPRAFAQGGDAWVLVSTRSSAFIDALQLVRYDGERIEILPEMPVPDPEYDSSAVVLEDGDAVYVAFGSHGLPTGDPTDPYRVYRFESGAFVEATTLRTTMFVKGEPVASGDDFHLTELVPGGGDEVVRYELDGTRRVIAASTSSHVFGPVRASDLGPAWVKYYVGSVDNRYSRNQYFDVARDVVVDLPFRWPDGVSEAGGTEAEDALFGAFDAGVQIIVPFEFGERVHMIANMVAGAGAAGDPYAMYLMRYER